MMIEDDTFKTFVHQLHDTETSLDDTPLIPRSDRRQEKPSKKNLTSTYAEFSCDAPGAVYISGPSQISPIKNYSAPDKILDWNHLRIFYYVARCQSFTKAADMIKMSQPALSRTVQKLETRLQEKLFHRNRHTRQLTLTSTGSMILNIITPGILQLESLTPCLINHHKESG